MKVGNISVSVSLCKPTGIYSNALLQLLAECHPSQLHMLTLSTYWNLYIRATVSSTFQNLPILRFSSITNIPSYKLHKLQNHQERKHSPKHLGQHCPAGTWLRCWGHERMGQTSWMHWVLPPWRKIGSFRIKQNVRMTRQVDTPTQTVNTDC